MTMPLNTPLAPTSSSATPFLLQAREAVSLEWFRQIVFNQRPLELEAKTKDRLDACRDFLSEKLVEKAIIYGITTGYGPLANQYISPDCSATLQQNLVYHLCSGVGPLYSETETRAIMLARLLSLVQGHSAIRSESVQRLIDFLNLGIHPQIPSIGTVGASGDLTPLAHMTLALMGEGRVSYAGNTYEAAELLAQNKLSPITLGNKEGLAFVNGTSAMGGLAAINQLMAQGLIAFAFHLAFLNAELMEAKAEAYHPNLGRVRPHPGQLKAHQWLWHQVQASEQVEHFNPKLGKLESESLNEAGIAHWKSIVQDPYSIRCLPQVFGAVLDVLNFHEQVVLTELTAVTDNPTFFADEDLVLHGGNFYGQHIAFASDALMNALIKVAIHSERRVARITDWTMNKGLPPFLQSHNIGLQSGFMGAQVSASALVAEMRSIAVPSSIQSIPTNANNQDIVPLGTLAARKVRQVSERLSELLAIESLIMAQAKTLVEENEARRQRHFSPRSESLYRFVRASSQPLEDDRPFSDEIQTLSQRLQRLILEDVELSEFGLIVKL